MPFQKDQQARLNTQEKYSRKIIMNQIFPQVWIHLSKEVRAHLVKVFSLVRSGVTEVRDQEVISDGFTVDDLKQITLEKMNKYIGSVETFPRAWEITLSKVYSELNPPVGEIAAKFKIDVETKDPEQFSKENEVPPFGEKTCSVCGCKMAGPGVTEDTVCAEIENHPTETNSEPALSIEVEKPWCESCDAKKPFHNINCPKHPKNA